MSAVKKSYQLLKFMHEHINEEIDPYNKDLQSLIEVNSKQLGRYLKDLSDVYDNIKVIKRGRKNFYKLIRPIDIINESFKNDSELGMLFEMAKESMPEIIEDWNKFSKSYNKPFLFFNMPYEDIKNLKEKRYFNELKDAIVDKLYCDIDVDEVYYENIKPFKLIFSDGNWYIAFEYEDNLYIKRVNFIKKFKKHNRKFNLLESDRYISWFENSYQNSFTQYNQQSKTAILLAKPKIGRYFKREIKKYLKSQNVLNEDDDGSVRFSIKYTHSLEVLPFIQKWMPDLLILEPKELRDEYIEKLQLSLDRHREL